MKFNEHQLSVLSKAASALRFHANNSDYLTEIAKKELLSIVDGLVEIQNRVLEKSTNNKNRRII